MITENLSTLKIHKLTKEQYNRELVAGRIDENALYLTPDEAADMSSYATIEQLNEKADASHIHDDLYYTETEVDEKIANAINEAKEDAANKDTVVLFEVQQSIPSTADDLGIYVHDVEPANAVTGDIWIDTTNDPSYIVPTIPEITEADNGKVLMVVNGKLQLVSLNLSVDANGIVSI